MTCNLIELFAEFHHVDTERTQGLTHLRIGFGDTCQDSQVDGC